MKAKDLNASKQCVKSVDRCAAKLFALLESTEPTGTLPPEQRQAVHEEVVAYLNQLGDDAFVETLRKLYVLAEREARRRANLRRTRRLLS